MSRARWVALVAMFVLLVPTSAALAHGGNPNYRSVIDEVTPKMPGVSFQVLDYDSYFQLLDQHGHEVVIYGYEGEPYARILKNGTVQVNERSPALYLNENRYAEVEGAADRQCQGAAEVEDLRSLRVVHLARPPDALHVARPAACRSKTRARKPRSSTTRSRSASKARKGDINGTLYWVGPANTSKTPFIIAGIAIVLIGGGLVLWIAATAA